MKYGLKNTNRMETEMEPTVKYQQFLDSSGKIVRLPQKQKVRHALLEYLAEKFEPGRTYAEREVNALCDEWHTFGDCFLLRRELIDHGLLCRERDGSRYWRAQTDERNVPNEL